MDWRGTSQIKDFDPEAINEFPTDWAAGPLHPGRLAPHLSGMLASLDGLHSKPSGHHTPMVSIIIML